MPTDSPTGGRIFEATRPVRLSDVTPKGRVRLDAVARYLQDIAHDDGIDAIGDEATAWVVRRTTVHIDRFPVFREEVALATWASGAGSRWAERRTSIIGSRGGSIEVAALWVHVDLSTGRPKVLPADFDRLYGAAVAGRTVSARLTHDGPAAGVDGVEWPLRFSDFDLLGHVNNAVYWAIVEEHLDLLAPLIVEVEYRGGIDRGQAVQVVAEGHSLWILADGSVAASARIMPERL